MVARTSSSAAPGFSAGDKPRVAVASDGTLAAIHEPTRVVVLEVPGCAAFAEIGIDPDAVASEIAWVGAPPRLLVLSRYESHSTAHLLDPYGPRSIAEVRLDSPMKLHAAVGAHALVAGATTAILTATDTGLTPYHFPARAAPVTAGAAAAQFIVALASSVEEWDPQSRLPKRRLKLARAAPITAIGGSDRVVWMTTQLDPARIEVIPLVNRGQPKLHDLPEPIAHITGHPHSDLVVCIGATSRRIYVVDLDGRQGPRIVGPEGIDRPESAALVTGRILGVLAAQAHRHVALVPLDGQPAPVIAAPATVPHDAIGEVATTVQLASPPLAAVRSLEPPRPVKARTPIVPLETGFGAGSEPDDALPVEVRRPQKVTAAPPAAAPLAAPSDEDFAAWRARANATQPRRDTDADLAEPGSSWRDELLAWQPGATPPEVPAIDTLVTRFDLPTPLYPALLSLYAAHLRGEGVAPVDLARLLGHRWDEALGRGVLARHGLVDHVGSRVHLSPPILRTLDELPPRTGTLVGTPGAVALLGPCSVVATDALSAIADRCLTSIGGAILIAAPDASPRELCVEARARGAAPLLRLSPSQLQHIPVDEPLILVVPDEATADQLGIPRLA